METLGCEGGIRAAEVEDVFGWWEGAVEGFGGGGHEGDDVRTGWRDGGHVWVRAGGMVYGVFRDVCLCRWSVGEISKHVKILD